MMFVAQFAPTRALISCRRSWWMLYCCDMSAVQGISLAVDGQSSVRTGNSFQKRLLKRNHGYVLSCLHVLNHAQMCELALKLSRIQRSWSPGIFLPGVL